MSVPAGQAGPSNHHQHGADASGSSSMPALSGGDAAAPAAIKGSSLKSIFGRRRSQDSREASRRVSVDAPPGHSASPLSRAALENENGHGGGLDGLFRSSTVAEGGEEPELAPPLHAKTASFLDRFAHKPSALSAQASALLKSQTLGGTTPPAPPHHPKARRASLLDLFSTTRRGSMLDHKSSSMLTSRAAPGEASTAGNQHGADEAAEWSGVDAELRQVKSHTSRRASMMSFFGSVAASARSMTSHISVDQDSNYSKAPSGVGAGGKSRRASMVEILGKRSKQVHAYDCAGGGGGGPPDWKGGRVVTCAVLDQETLKPL